MYRPKKCMKCGGKMKTYQQGGPTPEQLAAANAEAKRFALSRNLENAEYVHVGNQIPKYKDVKGNIIDSTYTPIPKQMINTVVPKEINSLEYFDDVNLPGYFDPATGDIKYVPQSYMHLPRFQQNRGKQAPIRGNGLAAMQQGGNPIIPIKGLIPSKNVNSTDIPQIAENPYVENEVDKAVRKGLIAPTEYFQGIQKETVLNTPSQLNTEEQGIDWRSMLNYLNAGLKGVAGKVDRNRQDQYMYNQLSTLGQMNPMPVNDFQPNPFSMYAKYGGNIKKYMKK